MSSLPLMVTLKFVTLVSKSVLLYANVMVALVAETYATLWMLTPAGALFKVKVVALNVASAKLVLASAKFTVAPFSVPSLSVPVAVRLGAEAVVRLPVSSVVL